MKRISSYGLSLTLNACLISVGVSACGQSDVECLADSACEEGLVCVSAQCVGPQLELGAQSWPLYRDEMHQRLATDCGVCHGVRGEGSSAGRFDQSLLVGTDEAGEPLIDPNAPPRDPKALIALPVASGDSGWRIYLDNLTQERLYASYVDTLEFINPDDPSRSLLLSYARGELAYKLEGETRAPVAHPVIYPMHEQQPAPNCLAPINGPAPLSFAGPQLEGAPPSPAQVSHERLLAWSALDHSALGRVWRFSLEGYQTHVAPIVERRCQGCHNAAGLTQGGFCFQAPTSAAELRLWAPMINVSAPDESAFVGFLAGEFDHQDYSLTPEDRASFSSALLYWLNTP